MSDRPVPSLSILIPVYRQDVAGLTAALKNQAEKLPVDWEIILLDDASGPPWSEQLRELAAQDHIHCQAQNTNIGRAAARNRLASLARYDALLFLDGDAEVSDTDYLKKMLEAYDGAHVMCGMTGYPMEKPEDPSKILRWKYGLRRESVPARKRRKNPWRSFSTFHFMAPAHIFSRVSFRQDQRGYGHEDTFFGLDLMHEHIPVRHLDVALTHTGIDTAGDFLEKTTEAVRTLAEMVMAEDCKGAVIHEIRLLRVYCRTAPLWKFSFLRNMLLRAMPSLKRHLLGSRNPSLKLFDLYKLGLLLSFLYATDG